ncbi:MAG: hypothetical protein AB7F31_04260 [Parachlamydiales bacterium]
MSATSSVALFKSGSRYGAGAHFIDTLALAFKNLGVPATLLDPLADDFADQIAHLLRHPPDACLALNANSLEFRVEGRPLHELIGAPLIGLYIDDPLTLTDRLSHPQLATFPCPRLAAWARERFGIPTACLYHGATPGEGSSERPIDLLLAATYEPPQVALPEEWITDNSPLSGHWLLDEAHRPRTDLALRAYRRERLLQKVAEAGYTVTLVGEGWEQCPAAAAHHNLGPLPFGQTLERIAQSKVVLHVQPPFCEGSHERPLNALLRGCAVLSDSTPFLSQQKGLLTYSWNNLEVLPYALKNWETLGKEGRQGVEYAHLWEHRATELLEMIREGRHL